MRKHLLVASLIVVAASPAWADIERAAIDLTPLFNQVVWPSLSVIALALAGYFAKKLTNKSDADTQEKTRAMVNAILQSGLQLAQKKVASSNLEHVDIQAGIVADTLRYAVANGPKALKSIGVDVETKEGRDEVAQKIEAMLAPAVMVAVSSPVAVSVATAATIANPAVPIGPAVPADPAVAVAPAAGSIAQVTADAKPPIN